MSSIDYPPAEEKWIGFEDIKPEEIQLDPTQPLFINPKEAARLLGIGAGTVYDLCKSRQNGFPAVKVGYLHKINRELLIEWAKRMAEEGLPIA